MQDTTRSRFASTSSICLAMALIFTPACVATESGSGAAPAVAPQLPTVQAGTRLDCTGPSQCPSGVCDADAGMCLAATEVAYVAPGGPGIACTVEAPCATLAAAAAVMAAGRQTIHMAPGTYAGGARLDAGLDVAIYGKHATIVDGLGGAAIHAAGPGHVAIFDLTATSQHRSFVCDGGASLTLTRVAVASLLGVDATNCASLRVTEASFEGPGVGVYARGDAPSVAEVVVTDTSFADVTAAIYLRQTSATMAGLIIERAGTGVSAEVTCPGTEPCVSLIDSAISGATKTPLTVTGNGFLVARNHLFANPAGGMQATAHVLRLESNVIRNNGAADVSAKPAVTIVANACFGCAAQVAIIGNTVVRNRSATRKGGGLLISGSATPVLASNIIFGNASLLFGAPQVVCTSCRSYNDLIAPASSEGAVRIAPIHGDPMFAALDEGDLRPLAPSPARNAGTCTTPEAWVAALSLDVDGERRATPCDAGAYEIP